MKRAKKVRLEGAGWAVGDAQEFLDLTDAEMAIIDMRVSLARALRQRRRVLRISQEAFAQRVGSSQSRVAKMEAGDPSVSLDLLIRALIRSGATAEEIATVIAASSAVGAGASHRSR